MADYTLRAKFGADLTEFRRGLNEFKGGISGLRSTLGGLAVGAAAITAVGVAFRGVVAAVRDAEQAAIVARRLDQVLRNMGESGPGAAAGLREVAAQLQRTTNFTDEAVLSAGALLGTFRSVGGSAGIGLLLPRLADMAAGMASATGETADLNSVARVLGRAIEGNVAGLSRFGVVLTESEKAAIEAATGLERVRLVTEALDARFKGMAATTSSAFVRLQNAVGELSETFGRRLEPAVSGAASSLAEFAASDEAVALADGLSAALVSVANGARQAGAALAPLASSMQALNGELRHVAQGLTVAGGAFRLMGVGIQAAMVPAQAFLGVLRLIVAQVRFLQGANLGSIIGGLRGTVGDKGGPVDLGGKGGETGAGLGALGGGGGSGGGAAAEIREAGITAQDAEPKFKALNDAVLDLAGSFGRIEGTTPAAELVEALRSVGRLAPEISFASAALKEMGQQINEMFAGALLDGIGALSNAFGGLVTGADNVGKSLGDAMKQIAAGVAAAIAQALILFGVLQLLDAVFPGAGKFVGGLLGLGASAIGGGSAGGGSVSVGQSGPAHLAAGNVVIPVAVLAQGYRRAVELERGAGNIR